MSAKIPGLDHLRALAITLVFLFHYRLFPHPDWVDTIGSFGWTGVDLFFVLSGYLISGAIFREQKAGSFRLPTFYLKRGFRILPAFWAVLAVYFLIPGFREWEHLPPLWKMLSFTQNLGLDLRHQRTFSHAWSLCIEEQFYLLLPLALLLVHRVAPRRRNSWIILLLFAAGFITRLLSWNYLVAPAINTDAFGALWYKWIYYPTYNRLDGLLAGIAIAALQHHTRSASVVLSKHSGWLLLTGLALLGCAYQLCIEPQSFAASIFGFPFIALAYAFLVAASVTPKSILNRWSFRISSVVAKLSYAIYLSHKGAIHLAQLVGEKFALDTHSTAVFFLSLLMAFSIALVLHYIIERPFLKWKERIVYR